jgi:hypothetical protein
MSVALITVSTAVSVLVLSHIPCAAAPRELLESQSTPAQEQSQTAQAASSNPAPELPRGRKLMLKDGTFQLVREYKVQGDRIRYYSLDSRQWEEMPAAMVDWDATHKLEAEEAQRDAAVVAKAHAAEAARKAEMPLDVDASIEAAPGVFLPPGEGLFVFDGRGVLPLSQALAGSALSKRRLLEQVLVPIPVVPSRHTISIPGTRAKFRLRNTQPEFYMRTADAREPEMVLIRVKVRRDDRVVENLDTLFKHAMEKRDELLMQRWLVARGVYRFTLGQPLAPGEYAFAENVQGEGMSLYVWDFGVDDAGTSPGSKQ